MKVEKTRVSRGSRLAAASNPCITLFIAAGSCPSSPSSWYSNPPVVDSPMIGGRLKGMTVAVRISRPSPNTRAIKACAELAAPLRSAKGFSVGTTNAVFGSLTPSMIEKPMIAKMFWTCGIVLNNASMCRTASLVRATEAPSGNCTEMKKAP